MSSHKEIVYDKAGNPHEVVDFANDYSGAKLGFWLFMLNEVILFGILFLGFSFYFYLFTDEFIKAAKDLSIPLGGVNTVILLISTLTMGLCFLNMKNGKIDISKKYLFATIFLALIFLGIKAIEWGLKISHNIYPSSELLKTYSNGEQLYYGLYYTFTGLHALHVIIGIIVMFIVLKKINSNSINKDQYIYLENTTLYWDLVHLVWIFVFPLFYMIGA